MNEYQYGKMLRTLNKGSNVAYLAFLKGEPPCTPKKLALALRIPCKRVRQSQEFKDIVADSAVKCVDNFLKTKRRHNYNNGKEFPVALKKVVAAGFITDDIKKKVSSKLGEMLPKFYPYAKKEMISVAAPWVDNEQDALDIIEKNFRSLDDDTLDTLVGKIQNGYDHDTIKRLSTKGMAFKARKFNKGNLSDPETRKQFLNNIAETPSLMTKIKHSIHLTMEDFQNLPPARRFKFIQQVFAPTMNSFFNKPRYSYYRRSSYSRESSAKEVAGKILNNYNTNTENAWFEKISIADINYEDLKSLLFSVAIHKNQEVVEWLDQYKKFSKKRKEVREIFENALKWL